MKVLSFLLIVGGILILVYGGINYSRQRTVLDVGPIKATTTEHRSFPISPIVGGLVLLGGVLLLVVPRRGTSRA